MEIPQAIAISSTMISLDIYHAIFNLTEEQQHKLVLSAMATLVVFPPCQGHKLLLGVYTCPLVPYSHDYYLDDDHDLYWIGWCTTHYRTIYICVVWMWAHVTCELFAAYMYYCKIFGK